MDNRNNNNRDNRNYNNRDNRNRDNRRPAWKRSDSPPMQRDLRVSPLEVVVYNNDVATALKVLKNKMSKEGILSEIKERRHYEKPSAYRRRKHLEAIKKMRRAQSRRTKAGGHKKGKKRNVKTHGGGEGEGQNFEG
jgi:small subunit ribosomal protein S21